MLGGWFVDDESVLRFVAVFNFLFMWSPRFLFFFVSAGACPPLELRERNGG